MEKRILYFLAVVSSLMFASCFGQHNEAPNKGVNLKSVRVYGDRNDEQPKQLKKKYPPATMETLERIANIKEKLYPTPKED